MPANKPPYKATALISEIKSNEKILATRTNEANETKKLAPEPKIKCLTIEF